MGHSNDQDMGSLMNEFFASVFTREDTNHSPAAKMRFQEQGNDKLYSHGITAGMMKSKLCKLKMNKAPGVDSVGTMIQTELSGEISHTVGDIFSTVSLRVQVNLKLANVAAVFKKSSKASPNYRPTSLIVNL